MENAFRLEMSVGADGKLEFNVPVAEGTKVEVLVLAPSDEEFSELVAASSTSLEFWNNALDEDWNNA